MPANSSLSALEISLAGIIGRETVMRQYIDKVKPLYGYIVLDTAPTLDLMTVNELAVVESVKRFGVREPGLARPHPDGAGPSGASCELLFGNWRKRACQLAGLDAMPVIARELDDDQTPWAFATRGLLHTAAAFQADARLTAKVQPCLGGKGKRHHRRKQKR
jgi:hypothetical protein